MNTWGPSELSSQFSYKHKTALKNEVYYFFLIDVGASLVVQWLEVCLPMQGTLINFF